MEVDLGLTGRGRCLELRQKRKPVDLAMSSSQVTFSGASPVGQTAKPQGGQADGSSNLYRLEARRLVVAGGWGWRGYGNCLLEDEKNKGSKLDESRVRQNELEGGWPPCSVGGCS